MTLPGTWRFVIIPRRRRNAPVFELDRPDHLSRGALRAHCRRDGATGEVAADFRDARARGHAGPADHHRPDERRTLLPAAPAGAFDQFAFLDGPKHRT